MIYKHFDESVAEEYFSSIRDMQLPAASAACSLSVASMNWPAVTELAALFISVVLISDIYGKGRKFRKIKDTYLIQYKGVIGYIALAGKTGTLSISYTILWLLALG